MWETTACFGDDHGWRPSGKAPGRTSKLMPATQTAQDRDHLLDRLENLRKIVPVFAEELANARRQSAQLRSENIKLLEQVRQLQRQHPPRAGVRAGSMAQQASARFTRRERSGGVAPHTPDADSQRRMAPLATG